MWWVARKGSPVLGLLKWRALLVAVGSFRDIAVRDRDILQVLDRVGWRWW